jgi:serine phosphatase RsbU (regulator of sigma subunit)
VDSLLRVIDQAPSDTQKLDLYYTRVIVPLENNERYEEMEKMALRAYELSKGADVQRKVNAGLALARAYLHMEKNIQSEKLIIELLSICRNLNMAKGSGNCYKQLAQLFFVQGDYTKSMQYSLEAQKKWEELNDPKQIAMGLMDLGRMNYYIGHNKQAAEYWEKAADIYRAEENEVELANTLGNLGLAYIEVGNYYRAETSLKKSIALCTKLGMKTALANAYTNYCKLMYHKNQIDQAIEYNNKAILIFEELNDSNYLSNNYSNGAEMLRIQKKYDLAIQYINKAFAIETKRNNQTNISALLLNRAAIYYDLGNYKQGYDDMQKHIEVQDSLINIDNQRSINDLQTKYDSEKKDRENKILKQENELRKAEDNRKNLLIIMGIVALSLLLVVGFVLARQNRIKQRANKELSDKNEIIEEQHKDITDSITYAKRIQEAIFPPDKMWYSILPESFVLYKPKDILSGDFYWIEETEEFIWLAAADCTGHGVPGALMSIVNFNLLNKAVLEKGIHDPGDILSAVNVWLTQSLHQSFNESSIKDGMDVALLSINKKTGEIKYAGAFNSVYHFSDNGFNEIKGDKFPVGAFIEESIKKFTTHTIHASKGDMLYIFSDGYADQFGGPKGKKFKYKRMKELLSRIRTQTPVTQEKVLETEFTKWKGANEQVDDVLVIGIRL